MCKLIHGRPRKQIAVCASAVGMVSFLIVVSFIGISGYNWGYGNGFYYSIITFSTIGLGDYAPNVSQVEPTSSRVIFAFLFTVVLSGGLALCGILIGAVAKSMSGNDEDEAAAAAASPAQAVNAASPAQAANAASEDVVEAQSLDLEDLSSITEALRTPSKGPAGKMQHTHLIGGNASNGHSLARATAAALARRKSKKDSDWENLHSNPLLLGGAISRGGGKSTV